MEDLDKIKERISKLLAMAKDSSSPAEAAIAASRARSLMDKYQLGEGDIDPLEQDTFHSETTGEAYKYCPQWRSMMAVAIAKYNDCQARFAWSTKKYRYKELQFLGYGNDVALAIEMYNRLAEAVDRWCKSYMARVNPGHYNARIGDAFKRGMACEISNRLGAMTTERDAIERAPGTSLVLVKRQNVDEHFGEVKYGKGTFDPVRSDSCTAHAYQSGKASGRAVQINQEVEQ